MANRRMFSLDVVDTDKFLDMPITTQALYFHLGMRADDDGFVSSPKRIVKTVGCNDDDLKLLIAKEYLIPFDNGVVVISDWNVNNWIRPDRKHNTRFLQEKGLLELNNDTYVLSRCLQPNVNQVSTKCHTEDRLGKDRLGEDSKNHICVPESHEITKKEITDSDEQLKKDFEIIYGIYPKKVGRTVAFANYKQWVSSKGKDVGGERYWLTNRQIYLAVKKYVRMQEDAGHDDLQYWKNFDTLMGRQLLDYVDLKDCKSECSAVGTTPKSQAKIEAEIYEIAHTIISEMAFERYHDKIHRLICLCCSEELFNEEQIDYMIHEWGEKPVPKESRLVPPDEENFYFWDNKLSDEEIEWDYV